jgi:NAD(P)-dependent dehydrogenase (short-subunit alcohol dehydrogenase family)
MKDIGLKKNKKYNQLLLENKVCVIVGAASLRSIGYATAELFAAHGAKLVLLDLVMNGEIAVSYTHLRAHET